VEVCSETGRQVRKALKDQPVDVVGKASHSERVTLDGRHAGVGEHLGREHVRSTKKLEWAVPLAVEGKGRFPSPPVGDLAARLGARSPGGFLHRAPSFGGELAPSSDEPPYLTDDNQGEHPSKALRDCRGRLLHLPCRQLPRRPRVLANLWATGRNRGGKGMSHSHHGTVAA
jgi:hypothetical protein